MSIKEIALQYIKFLENGEIDNITNLFTETGKVTSPIYGIKLANEFYKELLNDTQNSRLKLKGIFEEENSKRIAISFNYKWTLKNNSHIEFDVVDIIEFNENNKIIHLEIIYDTVKSRALVKSLKNNE